jgi:hypothetical protein
MKVYVLRTFKIDETKNPRRWVVFDHHRRINGKANESKQSVLSRWERTHGKITELIRFTGIMPPSEMAMTIADIQQQL